MDRPHRPVPISPSTAVPQPSVRDEHGKIIATLPTGDSVEILLYGATVISWKSNGTENLWLSQAAKLDGSKPVRGGIPVVFPVSDSQILFARGSTDYARMQCFGPPSKDHATGKLPQHGFARNSTWEYLGKTSSESGKLPSGGDGGVKLDFGLSSAQISQEAKEAWGYDFNLLYSVTLGKDGLQTMLNIQNNGKESFEFQMLLHTYFKVDVSVNCAMR